MSAVVIIEKEWIDNYGWRATAISGLSKNRRYVFTKIQANEKNFPAA